MVARAMTLGREHVTDVVAVLAEAFHDYPVMRYVLGASDDYAERLERLVTVFVMARVLRGETLLGVAGSDGLGAAALVSRPDAESPPELDALRERTWSRRTSPCTSTSATRSREAVRSTRPSRPGRCIGRPALRRPATQRTTSSSTSWTMFVAASTSSTSSPTSMTS